MRKHQNPQPHAILYFLLYTLLVDGTETPWGDQQDVNCETGLQEEFVTLLRTSRNVDSRVISSSSNVDD